MKRWLNGRGRLTLVGGNKVVSKNWTAGYTMTEVMIVLAVSGATFVMIALAFSGRQARVEFTRAVRDFEAQLQNIMSNVSAGHYQSEAVNCNAPLAPGDYPVIAPYNPVTDTKTCIFLGRIVKPSITGTSSEISTVLGRRRVSDKYVESLSEAKPIAPNELKDNYSHSFQLKVDKIVEAGTPTPVEYVAVGFISRLSGGISPSDNTGGGNFVSLYATDDPAYIDMSTGRIDDARLSSSSKGVIFCLLGQNGQRAEITVGANNNSTSIFSELDTSDTGVCS